ncbi:Chitotriosidase-1 [Daldinia childiae]|uniref:Chitotriosidase-1 n=1 Tax=Daldinia childiae TaxID=326645 RepID=UPI0014465D1D|nr:Chitotriosidase-1 [Daldinia childiae]KAF3055543.1 Chitotriosidase-1 [Daldinia childiae]
MMITPPKMRLDAPGAPCSNGACCSNTGVCSYAPTSCGPDVCISNCDAKAPCGPYAEASSAACPLKVCCSEFGFCGSTDEFCGSGCQDKYGGCGPAPKPQCEGDSTSARTIGYYESWAANRNCDKRNPEDLDLTAITHLNFAFAFFHPTTFQMMPMSAGDPELYKRFTGLKLKKQSLQCFISVGGWSFNDGTNVPNTRTAFSDMVSSAANRKTFIDSLSQFLNTYNFDGVDLDWEYPAAGDRGGVKADTSNFVTFLRELRAAFGGRYGISATIPNSYWYLQGFDVVAMQDSLDWFNLMSYDIHGVWDSTNKFTGPFIRPHTNWTEIDQGMDLLWRAGVDPSKVVLGLGWYGRSFTLSNAGCSEPNGICTFSEGGNPGECTANPGTLSNAELYRIIAAGGTQQGFDPTAAVKWITWNSSQWVSYDDGETIQMKTANGNKLCLGGVMIWAIDQDDIEGSSMNNLLGIGGANGVSAEEAANIKKQLNNADLATNIASSCYWSLSKTVLQ